MEKLPEFLEEKEDGVWFTEDDRGNLRISYRVKEIIAVEQSPFQHVMILDLYDFGPSLILDGVVNSTSVDGHIYNEMITHLPMTAHPDPRNVLIIGGGDCGAAREAVKYPSALIDMVEIDEAVVRLCKKHMPDVSGNLSDPRVNFIFGDGFDYIAKSKNKYDVIIIDSSDPAGPAVGLFKEEFYINVKEAMKEGGIMICQSESPVLYLPTLTGIRAALEKHYKIVRTAIATVPTYPGGLFSFTMASNKTDPSTWKGEWDKDTKYLTKDILINSYNLPPFIKTTLA